MRQTRSRSLVQRHPARGPRRTIALVLIAGLLLGSGCSTPIAPPPNAPTPPDYVVGAPDVLRVNVLPAPEIEREVTVRPDGMISVDLIGDVRAAGYTPTQIALDIQERIRRYKRDASVNVIVVSSPSQFVTIYGEVGRPGTFSLDTETRVSEAIGRVGGPRPFASLNGVRVIRPTSAEPQIFEVALGDIQKGDLSTNIVVQEGDLIVVPPTVLARIGYTMQMIFFPFQPLLGTAGSIGGAWFAYDRMTN